MLALESSSDAQALLQWVLSPKTPHRTCCWWCWWESSSGPQGALWVLGMRFLWEGSSALFFCLGLALWGCISLVAHAVSGPALPCPLPQQESQKTQHFLRERGREGSPASSQPTSAQTAVSRKGEHLLEEQSSSSYLSAPWLLELQRIPKAFIFRLSMFAVLEMKTEQVKKY